MVEDVLDQPTTRVRAVAAAAARHVLKQALAAGTRAAVLAPVLGL